MFLGAPGKEGRAAAGWQNWERAPLRPAALKRRAKAKAKAEAAGRRWPDMGGGNRVRKRPASDPVDEVPLADLLAVVDRGWLEPPQLPQQQRAAD